MASIFKPSRVIAVGIVVAATAWIGYGYMSHAEQAGTKPAGEAAVATASADAAAQAPEKAAVSPTDGTAAETAKPAEPAAAPPIAIQKVSVSTVEPKMHQQEIVLSCTTEADHSSVAVARASGVIIDLKVKRGDAVSAGQVVAILSDEGRDASLKQAEALLQQRKAEYESNKKLIERGNAPRINLPGIEAAVATAEAAVSAAQAELQKSLIKAPIDGIIDQVPVQLGQALQPGTEVAQIVDPDPMLAVGAVSERQRSALKLDQNVVTRFIDGATVNGTVSFVGVSADKATRTYRVEARMANPDAAIAEGVTCEMAVALDPVLATLVPRSALVFSDDGELGLRVADKDSVAQFVPVKLVDDTGATVWVTGIDGETRVIVVGQDFVKEGDKVEAVDVADSKNGAEPPA